MGSVQCKQNRKVGLNSVNNYQFQTGGRAQDNNGHRITNGYRDGESTLDKKLGVDRAILSYEQYLESGHQHTSKDTEITWECLVPIIS